MSKKASAPAPQPALAVEVALEQQPTFRELLIEKLTIIRDALPEGESPREFADDSAIDYDALRPGSNHEDVTYAVGYLRGAHEALDLTMSEMLDQEDIDDLQLDTEH